MRLILRLKLLHDQTDLHLYIVSVKKFVAEGHLPHLLFYGPPGMTCNCVTGDVMPFEALSLLVLFVINFCYRNWED